MIRRAVIPDATFFICFIGDINKPEYLLKILQSSYFKFITAKIILSEIKKHPISTDLKEEILKALENFKYHDYGEILKPFFSKMQIKRGEHEVIVISYI
jgi:hypothetical protein